VRQAEAMAHVRGCAGAKRRRRAAAKAKDPNTVALEKRVSDALGFAVGIDHRIPAEPAHPLNVMLGTARRDRPRLG